MERSIFYQIRRRFQVLFYDLTSPEFASKVYFRIMLGYRLNLKNPRTFNEKLQWLKLYEWPNNPLVVDCGDKYAVRAYIKEKRLDNYLNDLFGVWDDPSEIEWEKLPESFVIKISNACDENIICTDKAHFDKKEALKKLSKWKLEDFGKFNAEPHYSKMKKKIICEKYLGEGIIDYKFFCFNGIAKYMYISQYSGEANEIEKFFDREGKETEFQRSDYPIFENAPMPINFLELRTASEKLAADFPFVRVDWFEIEGRVVFSEMTFTPGGAMMPIKPVKYDYEWGNELDISDLMEKRTMR